MLQKKRWLKWEPTAVLSSISWKPAVSWASTRSSFCKSSSSYWKVSWNDMGAYIQVFLDLSHGLLVDHQVQLQMLRLYEWSQVLLQRWKIQVKIFLHLINLLITTTDSGCWSQCSADWGWLGEVDVSAAPAWSGRSTSCPGWKCPRGTGDLRCLGRCADSSQWDCRRKGASLSCWGSQLEAWRSDCAVALIDIMGSDLWINCLSRSPVEYEAKSVVVQALDTVTWISSCFSHPAGNASRVASSPWSPGTWLWSWSCADSCCSPVTTE